MKYYFFAATLPLISIDSPPPISFEVFRQLCREQLTPPDRAVVDAVSNDEAIKADPPPDMPLFYRRWHAIETQLRNAVAARRVPAGEHDGASQRRPHEGYRVEIERAVETAYGLASPLEREYALDQLRWRLLEELGGSDPFAGEAVLAYACRLRISERWASLNAKAGRQRFSGTLERVVDERRRVETAERVEK